MRRPLTRYDPLPSMLVHVVVLLVLLLLRRAAVEISIGAELALLLRRLVLSSEDVASVSAFTCRWDSRSERNEGFISLAASYKTAKKKGELTVSWVGLVPRVFGLGVLLLEA